MVIYGPYIRNVIQMKLKELMARSYVDTAPVYSNWSEHISTYLAGFEAALELAATTCEKAQKESGEPMCLLNRDRLATGLRKIGETSDET